MMQKQSAAHGGKSPWAAAIKIGLNQHDAPKSNAPLPCSSRVIIRDDGLMGQRGIITRIAEHLREIILCVSHLDIGNLAVGISYRCINWVYKTSVRGYRELCITVEHFTVQCRVDFDCILFNQGGSGSIVALALYALYLGKKLAEKVAQCFVIIDLDRKSVV